MTKESILNGIKSGHTDFVGEIYDSEIELTNEELKGTFYISFEDCLFTKKVTFLNINNEELDVSFINCKFESELSFKKSNFYGLKINGVKFINEIKIISSSFKSLSIKSFENELKGKILFSNVKVEDNLDMSNLKIIEGEVKLNFKITNKEKSIVRFEDSLFHSLIFIGSDLGFDANFTNLKTLKLGYFHDCLFNKTSFENSDFGSEIVFVDCKFNSYIGFEDVANLTETNFKISSCLFKGFPHFNRSKIKNLVVEHTTFERKVSFDFVEIDILKFYQVTFKDGAFFDYFKINEIESCDMVTVRTIKRELVNSHNQIDYLRFKSYELEAYKNEKGKDWKDDFILKLNSYSSKNGLDWFRGLLFTIFGSILIFYLYTIFEVYHFFSNPLDYSFISSDRVNEYFLFLNPTGFDYHFEKLKSNKTNFVATITFIFAKIFIAYGIYQTIQAFRKFGKNGD